MIVMMKFNKKPFKFMLFLLSMFVFDCVAQQDTLRKLNYPQGYKEELNIVYTEVNGWQGKMDLYLPPATGKTPLVINIHGGGWNHGTRQGSIGGLNPFLKKGYAIANLSYRLTPTATAPAAVEDVRSALLFLLSHADQYNLDKAKIVVMGSSAGGHLALMCGLLGNNHLFDRGSFKGGDIKIAAIIDRYGITDVWDWAHGPHKTSSSALRWLGDRQNDQAFANSVSPLFYVDEHSAPVFIVHGDADPVVPYEHSVMLHNKLVSKGVKTAFITVPGGLHGNFAVEKGKELNVQMMNFLKELSLHK